MGTQFRAEAVVDAKAFGTAEPHKHTIVNEYGSAFAFFIGQVSEKRRCFEFWEKSVYNVRRVSPF